MISSPELMQTLRRNLAFAAATALATACVSEPTPDEQGPMVSARRILALDFSAPKTAARVDRLTELPAAMQDELLRPEAWRSEERVLRDEVQRATAVPGQLRAGATAELGRRPTAFGRMLPDLHKWEQDLADDLDLSMRLLGTSRHPMGEISDREHRTDPNDDRPELTFWQRLRRRLRF